MNYLIKHRNECRVFAATHLAECATELREWQDTGILRYGRIRELSKMCYKFIDNHDGLRMAESLVNRAAVDAAAAACEVAVFEGYVDGMPRIKWAAGGLPAGTKLYVRPAADLNGIEFVPTPTKDHDDANPLDP